MKLFSFSVAALALLAIAPLTAQASGERPLARAAVVPSVVGNPLTDNLAFSSAEKELFLDCADGGLHQLSLIDAGLIASGVNDPAAMNMYREQFFSVRNEAAGLADHSETPLKRIEVIHQVLHARLLRGGYNANATNLAATLQTGVYNCASATLLFVALAAELNIDAQAIEMPGHVRAIVKCGEQRYEVEVTCPVWQEAVRACANNETETDSTFSSGEIACTVSPCGLVAMIYYNRGIDAFNDRRFPEAVSANRKALLLDPTNQLALGNLLAAINNWALALCDARRFPEAEMLLAKGREYAPNHSAFVHNAMHVQQMWSQIQASGATEQQQTNAAMPTL